MFFSLDVPAPGWIMMGVAVLCAVFLLTVYRSKIHAIYRHSHYCGGLSAAAGVPVSVIVYCDDNPFSLENLLRVLMSQRYSSPFEVIIVNDGSSEAVKDLFNKLSQSHHNLYQTFIPSEAHNLSRRKLAMTLGIKAARNRHVLFLNASSSILSLDWLAAMGRHFAQGKDVVIGYAVYDKENDMSLGKRVRSFDTAADAVAYLSSALSGKPYRGHLENMGLNRDLFFGRKGFSGSLNLHNGIDDIFINEIATADNTGVELSENSIVILKGDKPSRLHRRWKWSHRFTGKYVSKRSRRVFGFSSLLLWLGTISAIAASVISLPNLVPGIALSALGLIMWVVIATTWRKAIVALGGRHLLLTLPWFIMTRPAYNLYYRIVEHRHRHENFTWSKPR